MVFLPDQPLTAMTLGTDGSVPRAVPNDLVVVLASHLLPGDVVQKILLLAVFVLGGWGVGRLLDRPLPAAVAASAYLWNAYVLERARHRPLGLPARLRRPALGAGLCSGRPRAAARRVATAGRDPGHHGAHRQHGAGHRGGARAGRPCLAPGRTSTRAGLGGDSASGAGGRLAVADPGAHPTRRAAHRPRGGGSLRVAGGHAAGGAGQCRDAGRHLEQRRSGPRSEPTRWSRP